jgi:hypothetical protein
VVIEFVTVTVDWGPHLRWNTCLNYGEIQSDTIDTCCYLFLGMVHCHTLCPNQDNDYQTIRYTAFSLPIGSNVTLRQLDNFPDSVGKGGNEWKLGRGRFSFVVYA